MKIFLYWKFQQLSSYDWVYSLPVRYESPVQRHSMISPSSTPSVVLHLHHHRQHAFLYWPLLPEIKKNEKSFRIKLWEKHVIETCLAHYSEFIFNVLDQMFNLLILYMILWHRQIFDFSNLLIINLSLEICIEWLQCWVREGFRTILES